MSVSKIAAVGVAALLLAGTPASADSISAVEEARAKERSGRPLTEMDVDQLERYGGNDDHPTYYTDGPYYDGPPPPYAAYPRGYVEYDDQD